VPPQEWWTDPAFWDEMFDFIFPPETLAEGEAEAARAAALLALPSGAAVLDLGCGPGRVAIPLAKAGFAVTGIDAQERHLARARAWADAQRVPLALRRGDISRLPDEAAFDAVLSLYTSFGYYAERADDQRVLDGAFRALRPGGRFLLETAHRDGVVRGLAVRERTLADGRRFREEPAFDPMSGVLEARWTVEGPAGSRGFTTRLRPYAATELAAMLAAAGFRDVRLHRDLDGGAPSIDRWTIVAVGTRP